MIYSCCYDVPMMFVSLYHSLARLPSFVLHMCICVNVCVEVNLIFEHVTWGAQSG
jgi:hypothetical protein